MELEPKVAKLIVKSLKDIINHEINLFDTSGTIIASTDTVRIGTSHEGARLAAKNQQTLTIEHDNQFKGAKKGINIPVLFNQSVVAIIGITGERRTFGEYYQKNDGDFDPRKLDSVDKFPSTAKLPQSSYDADRSSKR